MKRVLFVWMLAVLLSLSACGDRQPDAAADSAVTELVFRDAETAPQDVSGDSGMPLNEAETGAILSGGKLGAFYGSVILNADDTLCCVELTQEIESSTGTFMEPAAEIRLFPNGLPADLGGDAFQETCAVHGCPADAQRASSDGFVCFSAAFERPDAGGRTVGVLASVFCPESESGVRADRIRQLWEITEAFSNPDHALSLDAIYSGPDFPRQAETALVPISLETETALRAGAQSAMECFQADAATDPVIPARCRCGAMMIRAVNADGTQMLVNAKMAYLPTQWDWSDMDDGYRFADSAVPLWYSGQTTLRRGTGDLADWLVGTQGFLLVRNADGRWSVAESGPGGIVEENSAAYDGFLWVRWTL